MTRINDWPEFWPNKSRMKKEEFLKIISGFEKVPRIISHDEVDRLIETIKLLVVELGFLERVVEEYERSEVRF